MASKASVRHEAKPKAQQPDPGTDNNRKASSGIVPFPSQLVMYHLAKMSPHLQPGYPLTILISLSLPFLAFRCFSLPFVAFRCLSLPRCHSLPFVVIFPRIVTQAPYKPRSLNGHFHIAIACIFIFSHQHFG